MISSTWIHSFHGHRRDQLCTLILKSGSFHHRRKCTYISLQVLQRSQQVIEETWNLYLLHWKKITWKTFSQGVYIGQPNNDTKSGYNFFLYGQISILPKKKKRRNYLNITGFFARGSKSSYSGLQYVFLHWCLWCQCPSNFASLRSIPEGGNSFKCCYFNTLIWSPNNYALIYRSYPQSIEERPQNHFKSTIMQSF